MAPPAARAPVRCGCPREWFRHGTGEGRARRGAHRAERPEGAAHALTNRPRRLSSFKSGAFAEKQSDQGLPARGDDVGVSEEWVEAHHACKIALMSAAGVVQLYRTPHLSESRTQALLREAREKVSGQIAELSSETCFNLEISSPLSSHEAEVVLWLLGETFEMDKLTVGTVLSGGNGAEVVEVGPRMSFSTAWCSNATSIFKACGLGSKVSRAERSSRYQVVGLDRDKADAFASLVHDRMTECVYPAPLASFACETEPARVLEVPLMEKGRRALEEANDEMGLAFDDWDLGYYDNLFSRELGRNPTNVELFDLAQSNSEHSRHWFFNGSLTVDGEEVEETLFDIVRDTLKSSGGNSVISFKDNSSAISGFDVSRLEPEEAGRPSPMVAAQKRYDILFTAETHNFPCAIAPYPGAETGAGGRMRDTHATGVGSLLGAGTAGYCVGNLLIDGEAEPWEEPGADYPPGLAPPLQILIDASNGASDYGNKFGEPLVQGYTRTFGQRLASGERREWLKPIMFSGGIGQISNSHLDKAEPEVGMLVVKIGGPAYRIGMGGGAASSVPSGSNRAELDFNAVQRGDGEYAQKLYRVAKACVELGKANPIVSIHDQGAGGNCNCVKEIIYPAGAEIDIRAVHVGDETMSVLEIWGAEYQENDCLLIEPGSRELLEAICARERCLMSVIGTIKGDGRIVLKDNRAAPGDVCPEDLALDKVLGEMPQKAYSLRRDPSPGAPLQLPEWVTVSAALTRVLRLPSVASKRFLTSKVDRSVTGLVVQQQCVGPLQLPLADVAVVAQSYVDHTGGACAIGEQPVKGLVSPAAMARLAVTEAMTNLMWAPLTAVEDVKASVNWMYAAKIDGEGGAMYDAALSLREAMVSLGIGVDGGKDSLSMAASSAGETVKSPGNLVVSAYCTCPDITKVVTPDLKPGSKGGALLHVDLSDGGGSLGGSALAQVFGQVGDDTPDVPDMPLVRRAVEAVQDLMGQGLISAGHDVSDGGLVTTVLEMAFAGDCGVDVDVPSKHGALATLFAEQPGFVVEVCEGDLARVCALLDDRCVPHARIGSSMAGREVRVCVNGEECVREGTAHLRGQWEETAFRLERLQCADACVSEEKASLASRIAPEWHVPYVPSFTDTGALASTSKHKVAILREEGSNGDREMAAAFSAAGLEPWDVTMSDLLSSKVSLSSFRGVAFVGGFSYADVLDSAKGWAAGIRFNESLQEQFRAFYDRPDTFSLGVCNGCQLMALLGWVPGGSNEGDFLPRERQPRFVHNASGRFESRWSTVIVHESPAVMLQGMAGTTVGVWVAHGEGRAHFPDPAVRESLAGHGCFPIRFCDDAGEETERYPLNPNGSPEGITAICSPDGRHLAMMPHPERCFLNWQMPWSPTAAGLQPGGPSPWLKMFQNARAWCDGA